MDTKGITRNPLLTPNSKDLSDSRAISRGSEGAIGPNQVTKDFKDKSVSVALSDRGQKLVDERDKALAIARNTPAIREDRVSALKSQIQNGSYKIQSDKIADSILVEAIKDEIATKPEV